MQVNQVALESLGEANAIYCVHADKAIHEDVVSRRCRLDGCKKGPNFGPIGTFGAAHAIYCKEHADTTIHEDVVSARCGHNGWMKERIHTQQSWQNQCLLRSTRS